MNNEKTVTASPSLQGAALESAGARRLATPADLAAAIKTGAELVSEKQGTVKENLKKALGRYGKIKFSRFTATKVYECRGLLESGEDPFLLALYFNVEFSAIARIANDILRLQHDAKGPSDAPAPAIPTTVLEYLKLAERIMDAKEKAEAAERAAASAEGERLAEAADITAKEAAGESVPAT